MSTTQKVTPYLERLMDDKDLQDSLKDFFKTGTSAAGRARGKGSAKKAAKDPKVRQQALTALLAARQAAITLREPEKKPKSRWLKRLFVLALIGAGFYVAVDEEARGRLLEAVGAAGSEPTEASS